MKIHYDFHIHTALSPCGYEDMTSNNIVNMALLKGLDAVAVTDHNSALNVRSCCECGKKAGLIVLPGMEVETVEEVHVVALFSEVNQAEEFGSFVCQKLPAIKNRVDIFGPQNIMNCKDEVVGTVENLLSTATTLSLREAVEAIDSFGGLAIPAHIDKSSYSIISNLGFIPADIDFPTLEIKFPDNKDSFVKTHKLHGVNILHNSDAHFLWEISEKEFFISPKEPSPRGIIDYLKQKK